MTSKNSPSRVRWRIDQAILSTRDYHGQVMTDNAMSCPLIGRYMDVLFYVCQKYRWQVLDVIFHPRSVYMTICRDNVNMTVRISDHKTHVTGDRFILVCNVRNLGSLKYAVHRLSFGNFRLVGENIGNYVIQHDVSNEAIMNYV